MADWAEKRWTQTYEVRIGPKLGRAFDFLERLWDELLCTREKGQSTWLPIWVLGSPIVKAVGMLEDLQARWYLVASLFLRVN